MCLNPSHYSQPEALCRFRKPKAPINALLTHVLTTPETQAIDRQLLDTRRCHRSHAGLDPTRGSTSVIRSIDQGQPYEIRSQEKVVLSMISRNHKSRVMDLQIAPAHKYNVFRCGKGKDIGCEIILLPPLNNVSQFKRRG
jgi:hypothetical protein